ncbi:hypothetical protein [Amycolatopsis sp.]|uniref:hypothetical protein n=1 Tax=Amycolatopsis sp. TaxID=37632 RepID=UPI00263683F5|nr:hypothetical protein [Amycolatopsis sp.]
MESIYIRGVATTSVGNGKVTTALIQEFNTGKPVGTWHVSKAADLMRRLSALLESNRIQKMKTGKNLLSADDLGIAQSEAKELWGSLNSNDVTGKVSKYVSGNGPVKKGLEGARRNTLAAQAVSDIMGQSFEVGPRDRSPNPRPRQAGEPTRMKGFMKGFGIVGSAVVVAQAPMDIYNYGLEEGARGTLEGVVDPLDVVPDGQGVGCVFFDDCYVEAPPMS